MTFLAASFTVCSMSLLESGSGLERNVMRKAALTTSPEDASTIPESSTIFVIIGWNSNAHLDIASFIFISPNNLDVPLYIYRSSVIQIITYLKHSELQAFEKRICIS